MSYKHSPLVFEYHLPDGTLCLYHSISMELTYLKTAHCQEFWQRFANENVLPGANEAEYDLAKHLINHDFIIEPDTDAISESIQKSKEAIQKNEIKILYIVPTLRCNLRCKYCHIEFMPEKYVNLELDTATIRKGLDLFYSYPNSSKKRDVIFYGGEPFLRFDLVKFAIEQAKNIQHPESTSFTIFTNGTRIKEKDLDFINKNDCFVIVSLDGTKQVNDKCRLHENGSSSFEKVYDTCKNLHRANVKFGISLVMGLHNVESLKEQVTYLMEEFDPADLGISTLHLLPEGTNPLEVPIETVTSKMIEVFKMVRDRGFYVEHLFRRIRPFVEQTIRWKDCPSCGSKLLLYPENQIGFCEAFMGTKQYNFPLSTFQIDDNKDYDDWAGRSPLVEKDCYECPAIGICGGGCPYDAAVSDGSIKKMDKRRCIQSKLLLEWLINDLYLQLDVVSNGWVAPSPQARKKIYGKVKWGPDIPLQSYSKANEN